MPLSSVERARFQQWQSDKTCGTCGKPLQGDPVLLNDLAGGMVESIIDVQPARIEVVCANCGAVTRVDAATAGI